MTLRNALAKSLLVMALLLSTHPSGATELSFKLVTPPGITMVDLPQGPVLATADGRTIYKQLPRNVGSWGNAARQTEVVGQCIYQCPSEWPPVIAPAEAQPVGDFTIVTSAQGVRQWAYRGVPLETFIYDKKLGDTIGQDTYAFNGTGRIPIGEAAWIESEMPPAKPDKAPSPSLVRPSAIGIAQGLGGKRYFTDASGNMLYTHQGDCTGSCMDQWMPVPAGALCHAIGDWSIVDAGDGTRRWAFKGSPVYSFVNDKTPGIPMADGMDGKWRAAVEYDAPLPAEVGIGKTESDTVYTEKKTGRTLYFEGYKHRPYETLSFNRPGILYGTVKCYNECAKTYPPLVASADAKPVGEWWIITRADGVRQWAFRGIPVYIYADDKPGRALASNTYDRTWTEIPANMPPSSNGAS